MRKALLLSVSVINVQSKDKQSIVNLFILTLRQLI